MGIKTTAMTCGVARLLAAGALVCLAASCARQGFPVPGQLTATGELQALVDRPGTARVEVEHPGGAPPWTTLTMRNAGDESIKNVRLWGLGRGSLLGATGAHFKAEDAFTPFTLLPGEEFALSAPASTQAPSGEIFGRLHWITPRDPRRLAASFQRRSKYGVGITPAGAIQLTPGNGEAWLQMEVNAPMTYESFKVAWEAEPSPFEPQLWVNLEGDVWVRLPLAQHVDWAHPADITQAVAGHRRFWIRLFYEQPRTESWRGKPPETLTIRRVRIDREMQGPGRMKPWRTGKNEFTIHLEGNAPKLEIRMGK